MRPVPNSGSALVEFNPCHKPKGAGGGQFCATKGSDRAAAPARPASRPVPIRVRSVKAAIPLILQGKVVELTDARQVNTLLSRLARMAQDAQARGEHAPNYDLCKVSVRGTNLFCIERLRTDEHPEGVPRIHMPQFTGKPVPGSPADRLPRNLHGNVDAAGEFVAHLKSLGITTEAGKVPAASLKASQAELIGPRVAAMMTGRSFDPHEGHIFISRDNYVVDGHHRWAAVVGLDAKDNKLGDITMNVVRVDAPISEVLHIANRWTRQFGIRAKGV